jgi:hypothetical protein
MVSACAGIVAAMAARAETAAAHNNFARKIILISLEGMSKGLQV